MMPFSTYQCILLLSIVVVNNALSLLSKYRENRYNLWGLLVVYNTSSPDLFPAPIKRRVFTLIRHINTVFYMFMNTVGVLSHANRFF